MTVLLATTCVFLQGCEGFVRFTVKNERSEAVLVWAGAPKCDDPIGKREDYVATEQVPAGEAFDYFTNVGGGGAIMRCVFIADLERHVLVARPFEYDMTYVVTDSDKPSPEQFPLRETLPRKSWAEEMTDGPLLFTIFTFSVTIGMLLGILLATWLGLRSAFRRWGRGRV
jgi:hypothetical protein